MTEPAITDLPSPNCDARPGGPGAVDTLILHYTGMQTAQAAIDRLRDPQARVSSHYVVDEDGTVLRLVPEALRAFHAGISFWRGRRALNDVSVGIEIVNPGHEWGYRAFPRAQMAALIELCTSILARHAIPPCNVVGHSDVAPDRKQDPGELFDWEGLAAHGIGLWPRRRPGLAAQADATAARAALAAIGYDMEMPVEAVVAAFQRHFLPHAVSGTLDGATMERVFAVGSQEARLF